MIDRQMQIPVFRIRNPYLVFTGKPPDGSSYLKRWKIHFLHQCIQSHALSIFIKCAPYDACVGSYIHSRLYLSSRLQIYKKDVI